MADKKYKKCLGKLCFEGQFQTHSFLVELIFILLSLLSPGDSLITCELDYMLYFNFTSKLLQPNHKKNVIAQNCKSKKRRERFFRCSSNLVFYN